MNSIWAKTTDSPSFAKLTGARSTDVLIIGGGIAGILCAYKLKAEGVDCILVEADRICNGITGDTTAKITLAHGLMYHKTICRFGKEKAGLYAKAQQNAIKEYTRLCQTVDCDFEKKDAYVYSLKNLKKIEQEVDALKSLGIAAEISDESELPFPVAGALRVKDQAQFHPLKFLYSVAKDLPIYEHSKVVDLIPHKAVTDGGVVTFLKLIVATHFPIYNKHGAYFLKLYQHRSYVLALKDAPHINGMYVDESDTGLSLRGYRDLLLLGGGGHRTGKKGGCWQELEEFASQHYPKAKIVAKWATQDCMTLDDIPYIGDYSKNTPDTLVATGFNKWGMTNAMVAANILCDRIRGIENAYASVFSPSRSVFHPQLALNALESTVGLLTPTVPRCPHLGCALKYNSAEHTWDCPCHGSRFDEYGELIDNPATNDHSKFKR